MAGIHEIDAADWEPSFLAEEQELATSRLEAGDLLLLPRLNFRLQPNEMPLLSGDLATDSKNISYDPSQDRLKGVQLPEGQLQALKGMMARFSGCCQTLANRLLPRYSDRLVTGRTSYRPVEISNRSSSWRKDDTRLHVDSFPSSPVRGNRILRFFCNINPDDLPRSWRLGEPFESVAERFLPTLSTPLWGSRQVLRALHITKSERSAYDHYMLQLHDRMKADAEYQNSCPQRRVDFPAGSAWIVFTDQVSHAATHGRCALEQTFYLPVDAMQDRSHSPLNVLERLTGRPLVRALERDLAS